jgi:hypothetical protein
MPGVFQASLCRGRMQTSRFQGALTLYIYIYIYVYVYIFQEALSHDKRKDFGFSIIW